MIHLFIINPAAGSKDRTAMYTQAIEEVCGQRSLCYRIAVSAGPGDCQRIALGVGVVVQAHMILPGHRANNIGVDLVAEHQPIHRKMQGIRQNLIVSFHIFRRIAPMVADVQALQVATADTAQTGGETV